MSKSGRVPAGSRSDEGGEAEGEGREFVLRTQIHTWTGRVRKPDGSRSILAYAVTPLPSPPSPLSHDQRFFLKTQGRREVRALLAHLPRYVQHLQRHPHSLLARLLGTDLGLRGGGKGLRGDRGGEEAREWGGSGMGGAGDLSPVG